ncbi:MAG: alpha-glucan family phosphorylase [Bacteroidetes bacterium]|uniref:Alpha-glucan family phosphorylase n=1 Tax=Candidatus Cryptobacteroides faecavium TaxID=2840762 RepID=A0A9D9IDG4_9BACT|nr:alpha-glucan family phosphorylase [Candidatus Cryptobacteroides faecavium]
MNNELIRPDYLFEVSWEVCNKVGGIYTVLATKSLYLKTELKRHHILVGPDVWMDTENNPDFIEDPLLYRDWKAQAASEGLRLRVGRWNIHGQPTAILVDFKQFLTDQNNILTEYWKRFGVDSLTGNWDYKESALFGYAAGKVIESFYRYNLSPADKVVAQFHEWMTGAGLLYIKGTQLPIATVFTTHATVVGRCLAGNNLPLYDSMSLYDGDAKARDFNVLARHSLEKKSAQNADIFTTVSEITARECKQFLQRDVDVITPNGFENDFTPPTDEEYAQLRSAARSKLVEVATAMSGEPVPENSIFVGIGGRYEWRNKGIDVFIDALDSLNRSSFEGKSIQAFIFIPSGNNGPDKELVAKLSGTGSADYVTRTSHYLIDPEYDIISRRLNELNFKNAVGDKVKVYFIPSYLNGNDGVFNMTYYDLLAGLDLTLFPSYYEPWGYTPLESLAFKVPTATTTLAGFGLWVKEHSKGEHPGITVIPRNDSNYRNVVEDVVGRVKEIARLTKEERKAYMDNAREVSEIALWENNIVYYKKAYSEALVKVIAEKGAFPEVRDDKTMHYKKIDVNKPSWNSVFVSRHLPDSLKGLETLSRNLWWCWNESAKNLFRSVDEQAWEESGENPIAMLDKVKLKRYRALENDPAFLGSLKSVMDEFNAYMALKAERKSPSIAYFCMEYGLDTSLKIYSGGLGILAGDYLKETSDMNTNLVAVGLLYRYGYFTQMLSAQGEQVAKYDAQNFMKIPASPVRDADGNWMVVSVAFPGRTMNARLWRVDVGRTELYLMDTDYEDNLPEDRSVTHHLYGGDWENRLKQELLLGVGGIRALRKLGLNPEIYHCNEGHAAFIGLERLREYINNDNLDFPEALEVVRASSLFTTHTPVPAGHDTFDEGLLRKYIGHYPQRLKIDWTTMMGLGKLNGEDVNEKFSMSILAANMSQNMNGVSWLHGEVTREMFSNMWPGYLPEELYVSYVTNGVHYPTWTAQEWKDIHEKVFGDEFKTHHYDKSCFEGIYKVSDEEVWNVRTRLRKKLIDEVKDRLSNPAATNHYSPKQIVTIKETLRDDVLTIGFARRFATYKRAYLLFRDLDRLNEIVNDPARPVQFIFAGKAHPADKAGQDLIKKIVDISKMEQFIGKIVFVPDYDITLAKYLVQGVDVWMNNPTRPQEASGTSGEKASMNGVMHFSVLDGWWVEGYRPGAGWALPMESTYDDPNYQDELDAATIYATIENEIAPAFYNVDADGRSSEWIGYIKNTVAQVACNFTTNRMLTDYIVQYYNPQAERTASLVADDYKVARQIAAWKKHLRREWQNVGVISMVKPDSSHEDIALGKEFHAEVVLSIGDLQPEDVGVELLFASSDSKGALHIQEHFEFTPVESNDGVVRYEASLLPQTTGLYQVAARIYARNPLLPHRQDFELVRWL